MLDACERSFYEQFNSFFTNDCTILLYRRMCCRSISWAVLALEPMNQWICMKKLNVSSSKVERGCLSFLVIYYTSLIKWIILSIAGHIIAFMLVIQNQVKDTESILTLLINIGIIAIIIGIIMLPVAKNTIKRINEKESKE